MIACVEDIRIQKRAHFSESLNYDIPISREESLPGNGYIRSVHVEHAVIACNHICLKKNQYLKLIQQDAILGTMKLLVCKYWHSKAFFSSGKWTLFSCKFCQKKKEEEANHCCFDHQHGLLVTCLQTTNKAKFKKVNQSKTLFTCAQDNITSSSF